MVSTTKEVKLHAKEIYVSSASFTGSDGKVSMRVYKRIRRLDIKERQKLMIANELTCAVKMSHLLLARGHHTFVAI